MKRLVKPLLVFGMLFLLIGFSMAMWAENAPSPEVIAAAQQGLADFPGLTGAALDQGFQVYTVTPDSLMSCSDLGKASIPTGQWRFMVLGGGQPLGLLTVAQVEGRWQAVSMGGAGLATEMNR
ncbi:MAG: hypothetical protein MUF15_22095, partial [Acidobacteria bacterium]|nr:hypothetical protein [Acidobacteriota bacterium]